MDSFSNRFRTVSYSILSLSFGKFYNHAYIFIIEKKIQITQNKMKNECLNAAKHIRDTSKKNVTFAKI